MISHLNAHVERGMKWLDDVVVPGLRKGDGRCEWEIEVHGNDEEPTTDYDADEASSEGPGPAVYVIYKKRSKIEPKAFDDNNPPAISLRFHTY